jgi:hypothetical protein
MARYEQDREDILREATALVERVELSIPDCTEPIVAGFRRDGSASFYFGADPVLQFNVHGKLRRAYDQNQLIKAVRGKLVIMRRVRDEHATTLESRDMVDSEWTVFHDRMLALLAKLRNALRSGTARVDRQVPEIVDVTARVAGWLEHHGDQLMIADRPNV